jgi:hypothetical protein
VFNSIAVGPGSANLVVRYEDANGIVRNVQLSESIKMLTEDSFNRLFEPVNVFFPSLIPYAVTTNSRRYIRNC